jgi:SagB-type dehydrogenase family enzyme
MLRLAHTACSVRSINEALLQAHEESRLTTFYRYLSCLLRHRMAMIGAGEQSEDRALATLLPISPSFRHLWVTILPERCYRLSRFAYIRREDDGYCYLESPLAHARLRLEQAQAASLVYLLARAVTAGELARAAPAEEREQVMGLLTLLVMGNFASLTTSQGQPIVECDAAARLWDFHDLVFHSRSRSGRHDNELGGTYRFVSQLPPQPAVKQATWPVALALFRPDLQRLRLEDPGLTTVLEERTSIRAYGEQPITVAQLGEFLYRVARVREIEDRGEMGECSRRPYPGAGASYELELYLTVEHCEGLAPGFYWYNPQEHTLSLVRPPAHKTRQLLTDARQAMGSAARPQVLITLAARFQRVSWKYQGLTYALILKDVGVLYATMYLVATAMDLAPCALGAGDSDLFAQLCGTDYLAETSVGEFMLGSRPTS